MTSILKWPVWVVALVLIGCGRGPDGAGGAARPAAAPAPTVLFRAHFIGTTEAAGREGGGKLKEVLALPVSQRLVEQTLSRLAASPPRLLPGAAVAADANPAALLQPLLADWMRAESVLQCYGTTNGIPEWTLAVRLDDERAKAWDTAARQCATVLQLGAPTPLTNGAAIGWGTRRAIEPSRFALVRAGKWTVLSLGGATLAGLDGFVGKIASTQHPAGRAAAHWLEVEADIPKLSHWLKDWAPWALPSLQFGVSGKGQSLRTEGRLVFDRPMIGNLPAWQVPTNSIRDPLVSFAATRGLQAWAAATPALARLGLDPMPGQHFVWGQSDFPYQTFLGAVVPNPTNALQQLAARIPSLVPSNANRGGLGRIAWVTNNLEIQWQGLPIVNPFVRARPSVDPHLVLAGVWPASQSQTPMPEALLQQFIGRSDLVHYGWEVTQARIAHWRSLVQLPDVIQNRPLLPPEAAGQRWFEALLQPGNDPAGRQALLSWPNAITEATKRSATELAFVRSSPLGLTALELVELVHWLDSETFPLPDRRPKGTVLEEHRRRR